MTERTVAPGRVLTVQAGDITTIEADAIVNAANSALMPGSGVCGAIHGVGGPAIVADLERRYGRDRHCPTGSAVASAAGDLPATWVIHAVGPVWHGGRDGEATLLASAYATAMRVADELGAAHIAFPAISTGIFGYPIEDAAAIAVRTLADELLAARSVRRVTIVARAGTTLGPLEAALADLALGG